MEKHFLEGNVTRVEREEIKRAIGMLDLEPEDDELLDEIVEKAYEIVKPRGVFMPAEIEEMGEDYIVVNGEKLTSALVREKVKHCRNVYPYVATCGSELREFASQYTDDILTMLACDAMQELYLGMMIAIMAKEAKKLYFSDKDMSSMAPGSLEAEWPITQQEHLFNILGDAPEKIGVSLNKSFLMIPEKSVSGFYFSSEEHFENCMLCTRFDCPNRRAPYKGNK